MSSGTEFGGVIGAAVVGTAGLALGAGWMLWSAGKLLVQANQAITEDIRRTQELQRLEAQQRLAMAMKGRQQLEQLCRGQLQSLSVPRPGESGEERRERESLCRALRQILAEEPGEDSQKLNSSNVMQLNRVERLLNEYRQMRERRAQAEPGDAALSSRLESLRTAFDAVQLEELQGEEISAPDPAVLERAELNSRLIPLSARIKRTLGLLEQFEKDFGLSRANRLWYHSCFDGVDREIGLLCEPETDNAAIKKGLRRLEELQQQAELLLPELQKEHSRFAALYPIYQQAAQALLVEVRPAADFDTADELEQEMRKLQQREQRAAECRKIYGALGREGYLCYAWDQELRAMGYQVYRRDAVTRLAGTKPEYARAEGKKLPVYRWDPETMTQFYQLDENCSLQLVVHPDGSTTMQTISHREGEGTVHSQKKHCAALAALRERLRENWFISYDEKETAPPELLMSAQAWLESRDNAWQSDALRGVRVNENKEETKPGQMAVKP